MQTSLAIHGGQPVRDQLLVFGAPLIGEEEIAEVVATLRSGWIGTGPRAVKFEEEFAAYVGARHAISLNSCTAGLFLGLKAFDIGPGDEVITSPLTFAATANVIEHVGARPVFVDIDPLTLNIDPERVAAAISPRTKAIVPVHFGGLACDMHALRSLATRHDLVLVEDAAHATGSKYNGQMVGSIGQVTAFSFYANKNLTTAEGGMLTTDDDDLNERLRILRLHGLSRDAWKRFASRKLMRSEVVLPGYKFNMPDLAAALGIHQLRKQEAFLSVRERYAGEYDRAFADLPVRRQLRPAEGSLSRHSLHLYVLILEAGRWRVSRDEVIDALLAENIGAALHYRAVHTHPYYQEKYQYAPTDFPQAYQVGENILSLPLTPAMNDQDVQDVITAVRRVAAAYAV
jgi:dTDP-4-amino-4,6-dideoxygalactose transaminase